jgi:hypothetical protein
VTVLPLTVVALTVAHVVQNGSVGDVTRAITSTTPITGVQHVFWTTAPCSSFERVPGFTNFAGGSIRCLVVPSPFSQGVRGARHVPAA